MRSGCNWVSEPSAQSILQHGVWISPRNPKSTSALVVVVRPESVGPSNPATAATSWIEGSFGLADSQGSAFSTHQTCPRTSISKRKPPCPYTNNHSTYRSGVDSRAGTESLVIKGHTVSVIAGRGSTSLTLSPQPCSRRFRTEWDPPCCLVEHPGVSHNFPGFWPERCIAA